MSSFFFFFFNDTATTEIYTLSLHDALPISTVTSPNTCGWRRISFAVMVSATSSTSHSPACIASSAWNTTWSSRSRSEEHTSELQSQSNLVCRLLLEKKKNQNISKTHT